MFQLPKPQQIRWNQNALRGEEARQAIQIRDDNHNMQQAKHRMMMAKARQMQAAQAAEKKRQEQQNATMRKHLDNGALEGVTDTQRQFLYDNPAIARQMMVDRISGLSKTQKPTALMQNLEAAGLQPGSEEYRKAIVNGTKRGMIINNQLPGAGKGTNKLTEKLAEQAASVFDQSASAQDLYGKYAQINEYAQDPNVRTGTLGSFELGVKKLGNTVFGLEFDGLPEAEQIQKVGDLLVGDIRKLQGDTRMSDADRRAYRAIPPNIGDSKQGIMLATEIMRKTADGMAKRQRHLSQLMTNNGGLFDANVWAQYNQYINKNPLITREDVIKARSLSRKAKQNMPGAGMNLDKINQELLRRGVK